MKRTSRALRQNRFVILMLMLTLSMPALYAQATSPEVTISLKNAGLEDFVKAVEAATDYSFVYGEDIRLKRGININVRQIPLHRVLERVFEQEEVGFKLTEKHILLYRKEAERGSRRFTISGYVVDSTSRETLIGANIFEGAHNRGTTTNSYGFYSLTLPEGELNLQYSYIGYETREARIRLQRDTIINIPMKDNNLLGEVVVLSDKNETGFRATRMGAIDIPMEHLRNTPNMLGEADVMKAIQLLPGVQAGVEGSSGIHVRGGGPDQNLILLDGIPLYNVDHLLGFFSVFTPEAVKKVSFFKSSFPARFGGRLSSVVDVRTNDGDMQRFHGSFTLGALTSKLQLEGPIVKDRTSFNISVRRTYLDLMINAFMKDDEKLGYYFYDINAKINHRFNDRSRLFLSVYNGKDKYFYRFNDADSSELGAGDSQPVHYETSSMDRQAVDWGNTVFAARWNYIFNNKLFSNTTIAFNNYHSDMNLTMSNTEINGDYRFFTKYQADYNSGIQDLSYNVDFDYNPTPDHHVKFGGGYLYHDFKPEVLSSRIKETGDEAPIDTTFHIIPARAIKAHEASVYIEDNVNLGTAWQLNAGLHLSMFSVQGKSYFSLQPRLSARYGITDRLALKASYTKMNQYIHLLSTSLISMPTDLWVPVTPNIKPMRAHQYSLGGHYAGAKGWEFSIEGYYKDMRNVLEYKDGTSFIGSSVNWDAKVEMGKGRSRGVELMVQKTTGRTTGWLSYTLAKADRLFSEGGINNGLRFPYKYDRRHTINLALNRKVSKRIDLNATWLFATGNTTTLGEEQMAVIFPGDKNAYNWQTNLRPDPGIMQVDYITSRNNYRLPATHRLNLSFNFHRIKKHGESIWNISLYNAYNAMNPNLVFWDTDDNGQLVLKKVTILPCLPSFSYTYKF